MTLNYLLRILLFISITHALKCGFNYGKCPAGQCCSKNGNCGETATYCSLSNGCQMNYGECRSYNHKRSTPTMNYVPEIMKESYNSLPNPYIGYFHGSVTVDLTDSTDIDCNFIHAFGKVRRYKNGLQYLGIRLSEYYNQNITSNALISLDNLLDEYKKRKEELDPTTQIILRFYYDSGKSSTTNNPTKGTNDRKKSEEDTFVKKELDNGDLYVTNSDITYMKKHYNPNINKKLKFRYDKDNGQWKTKFTKLSKRENGQFILKEGSNCYKYEPTDLEPVNVDTILNHVDQLSEIVNKYKDIIYILQGVFVGKWGEIHGTTHAKSLDSCTKIMNALNNKIDSSIFLSVRTPCHYRGITEEIRKLSEQKLPKIKE